ncbi:protein SYS1 homolog [Antedon mediterranea]|uniref:protein SYS1 homolog n=1 Tax=Antedon mediterranea TaxID=105859 RepID=UPI003AF9A83C
MASFRSYVWDPILIISQMLSMQTVFYVSLGFWLILIDNISSTNKSLDQIFNHQSLDISSGSGKVILIAFMLNSLTGAVSLWLIVRRSKQCWDFAITVHIIHLLACWVYNIRFPSTMTWWLTNISCAALMTVLGEYLCMRSEMKAIPVSGGRADL